MNIYLKYMSKKYITNYNKIIDSFVCILLEVIASFTKDHLFPFLNWGLLHFLDKTKCHLYKMKMNEKVIKASSVFVDVVIKTII